MVMFAPEIKLKGLGSLEADHDWFHEQSDGLHEDRKVAIWMIVLIAVAILLCLALIITPVVCCVLRKRKAEGMLSPRVANEP